MLNSMSIMDNKTLHINEIFKIIEDKNLEYLYNTSPIIRKFYDSTSKLRACLSKRKKLKIPAAKLSQLSKNAPTKLSPVFQIDFLGQDIPHVFNQYCISIAGAYFYLPITSDTTQGYFYKVPDQFFWINIDFGFRLASSGWDRISLLLNLAFNLQIEKYNISSVLKAIPNKDINLANDESYKNLKRFRDTELRELEFGLGGGARNETTHVISRSTRFFFEFLEDSQYGSDKFKIRRDGELKLLEKHYWLLMDGINNAYDLIMNNFDEKFYK